MVLSNDNVQSNTEVPSPVDIVLAEDDPFIGRMYMIKLQTSSKRVEVATSGRVAVEKIAKFSPKLVLLDINMPELNGFEVYDVLKNNHYDWSATKVIFLSNSSSSEYIQRAKKLGCDYVVKSDSTPKQVLELIEAKLKS